MRGTLEVVLNNRAVVMAVVVGAQDATTIAGAIHTKIVVVQIVLAIQNALIIQGAIVIWYVNHTKTVPVGIVQRIQCDAQGAAVCEEVRLIHI